jgi:hypothetical protein
MRRHKSNWRVTILVWSLILVAAAVFGGAAFGALRILTDLPAWLIILISAILALSGFGMFSWTHSTNGFDGIYGDPPGVLLSGKRADDPNKRDDTEAT